MTDRSPAWRTSSFTNGSGSCVEVAPTAPTAPTASDWLVRDSKSPATGTLRLAGAAFDRLTAFVRCP